MQEGEQTFDAQLQISRKLAQESLQNAKSFYCVSIDSEGKAVMNIAIRETPKMCVGILSAIIQDLEARLGDLCESLSVQENIKTD